MHTNLWRSEADAEGLSQVLSTECIEESFSQESRAYWLASLLQGSPGTVS